MESSKKETSKSCAYHDAVSFSQISNIGSCGYHTHSSNPFSLFEFLHLCSTQILNLSLSLSQGDLFLQQIWTISSET
ncbi:hypothetical protein CMV_006717 [Castanea mollissima]|uniref:Uncharacterized protein n=1 Tax=Castanea mollissima TaxID=60419 RepID=A0A8J4RP42_9ROSI|nr:hypothetical protein CMV_006717 [Castanea mollissima]